MTTITKIIEAYSYTELSDTAKETVKQWYLDDDFRTMYLSEFIEEDLKNLYPNSDLKVTYSLGYCQGDGLNIYGTLNLYDYIEQWNATDKERRTIAFYLEYINAIYKFENGSRYCYSQKFIDKKWINEEAGDLIAELEYHDISNINNNLIHRFYNDMIDDFEKLDKQFEEFGYNYLYEADDDEIADFCDINNYLFDADGEVIY